MFMTKFKTKGVRMVRQRYLLDVLVTRLQIFRKILTNLSSLYDFFSSFNEDLA